MNLENKGIEDIFVYDLMDSDKKELLVLYEDGTSEVYIPSGKKQGNAVTHVYKKYFLKKSGKKK